MTQPSGLPAARTPDPAAVPALRWGVIGPGWIAERFVGAVQRNTAQQVVAAASRDGGRAAAFAARFGLPRSFGSYDDLVADPDLDVVYVATPHPSHHAHAMLALEAGKHVLVEKPMAVTAAQAREIAAAARSRGLFCAEAFWTFFLPKYDVIRQVVAAGTLGDVVTVIADYGEHFGPDHRIMRADLGGGPLFDLGTYPLSLALDMLAGPVDVVVSGSDAPSGVNGQASVLLTGTDGKQAVIHMTILGNTPTTAVIAGTEATLTVAGEFNMPGPFSVRFADGRPSLEYREERVGHEALYYEAAEAARCISLGLGETPLRPLDASIRLLTVMDEIRRQLGVPDLPDPA